MDFLARPLLFLCAFATTALGVPPVVTIDDPPANGVPNTFPVGKTLIFPITATDSAGGPLKFKVSSSNPKVLVRAKTGEPSLKMTVTYGSPTQSGEMVFALFREWAPVTASFIGGFAQSGFYDNVKFHRVVSGFAIQGGDPLGTGAGGPGFDFDNEFQPGLIFSGRGQLAMANGGYDSDYAGTNGSQFFVALAQPRFLDFKHTIFGQLLRGWATLDGIASVPVHANSSGEVSAPDTNVVITSASVVPNNHDAVLVLSATGLANNVTITVTADDGNGGATTKTFLVSAVADTSNSPPALQNVPSQTVAKETELNFPLKSFDLEADYTVVNSGVLAGDAEDLTKGFIAGIQGNAGFVGQARLAFNISQFNMGQGAFDSPTVQSYTLIGIGDRAVRTTPMSVKGVPGAAFTRVVARFQDLDPAGTAADFTTPASNTTINWGDGTPLQNGALAADTSVAGPANFAVTGTHTYAKAGIYTIVVTATGTKGAVGLARNQAIISAGTILAVGAELEIKGPTVANRILATFTDTNAPGRPADYAATVDWGDGQSSKGVVSKAGDQSYLIRGTHAYKDAEPFAISVQIEKAGAADAFAWSTANLGGFAPAPHLPPFPMAHLVGAWNSGPTKQVTAGLTTTLTGATLDASKLAERFSGAFIVVNAGTRASATSKLRYFLSRAPVSIASFSVASPTVITTASTHGLATGDEVIINGAVGGGFSLSIDGSFTATVIDSTHFTVPVTCTNAAVSSPGSVFSRTSALTGAMQLKVNALPEIPLTSFPKGAGFSAQYTVALPATLSGTGRYLLSQLVYSDPIIDASKVDKVVVTGPINGVYAFNAVSDIGITQQGAVLTSENGVNGGKATFQVVLDTAPTANVTIAVASSLPTEGTVDKASLLFTPGNWSVAQKVTVTGVNDNVKDGNQSYTVTLSTPLSTDPKYSGSAPIQISFLNLDND